MTEGPPLTNPPSHLPRSPRLFAPHTHPPTLTLHPPTLPPLTHFPGLSCFQDRTPESVPTLISSSCPCRSGLQAGRGEQQTLEGCRVPVPSAPSHVNVWIWRTTLTHEETTRVEGEEENSACSLGIGLLLGDPCPLPSCSLTTTWSSTCSGRRVPRGNHSCSTTPAT